MSENHKQSFSVAVIGAGPAGIYAARELAQAGAQVALINRDIKPGGLAEYGIYPNKYKMKDGLRRQFRQVMDEDNITYFGNLSVGLNNDIGLDVLRAMGFDALLVTVGAQGTKWLGLPGEDLVGVYHAKDLVYHYNKLPPFSEQPFEIGERILCVGVGNVMLDIAHWAIRDLKVDEVIAIARRGPADVKFSKKEMEIVGANLDLEALEAEFDRTGPVMEAAGQNTEEAKAFLLAAVEGSQPAISDTRFALEFLASPKQMLGDDQGRVRAIEVEDTTLEMRDGGGTGAVSLGSTREIECDTVVFCIGDRVDESLGLPLDKWGDFAKAPSPRFPIDDLSYEAYNPQNNNLLDGIFLAGWAREASSGLVGSARKDGINGAKAVQAYLESKPASGADAVTQLAARVSALGQPVVHKTHIQALEAAEAAKAQELDLHEFKYLSNEDMLAAMGLMGQAESV
jgi:ferredoxin--NADP+ reductase